MEGWEGGSRRGLGGLEGPDGWEMGGKWVGKRDAVGYGHFQISLHHVFSQAFWQALANIRSTTGNHSSSQLARFTTLWIRRCAATTTSRKPIPIRSFRALLPHHRSLRELYKPTLLRIPLCQQPRGRLLQPLPPPPTKTIPPQSLPYARLHPKQKPDIKTKQGDGARPCTYTITIRNLQPKPFFADPQRQGL